MEMKSKHLYFFPGSQEVELKSLTDLCFYLGIEGWLNFSGDEQNQVPVSLSKTSSQRKEYKLA